MKLTVVVSSLILVTSFALAEPMGSIVLPSPDRDGGKPLMQALSARESQRSFSTEPLPDQALSNLLWAAFGINRPESGKRTAPSAVNWQEIDIYVALPAGLYLYDPEDHALDLVLEEDLRDRAGTQAFTGVAPVDLIYVADFSRMRGDEEKKTFYSATDTGFISQNVYLYCSSEGLATVVLGLVDKPALAEAMGLREDQRIILTQPVGYPGQ
jgi:SagB-type dehydrogenase family enzyme